MGSQLHDLDSLSTILICINDSDESVREAIKSCLIQWGMQKPEKVITACHSIMKSLLSEDVLDNRCLLLLSVVCEIFNEKLKSLLFDQLPEGLIETFCNLITHETSADILIHTAFEALVSLSSLGRLQVMEFLLHRFKKEELPNVKLIELSGRIAFGHSHNIMQILPVLLSQTMKYMTQDVNDLVRSSLITALGQYCDSSIEYLAQTRNDESKCGSKTAIVDLISPHACKMMNLVITNLLPSSKDSQLLTAIYYNLGSIMCMTDAAYQMNHLSKLLHILAGHLKKSTSPNELNIVHSMNIIFTNLLSPTTCCSHVAPCDHASSTRRTSTASEDANTDLLSVADLEQLLNSLSHQLSVVTQRHFTKSSTSDLMAALSSKIMNELKRAMATLCAYQPTVVLNFLLSHIHTGSDLSKTAVLETLRHVIASCDGQIFTRDMRKSIMANLSRLLYQGGATPPTTRRSLIKSNLMGSVVSASPLGRDRSSNLLGSICAGVHLSGCVLYALIKMVLTLGSLDYFNISGKNYVFVEFIIRQCALNVMPTVEKSNRQSPNSVELYELCSHVLKLSSTTVPCMHSILWPFLTEFILNTECTGAIGVVCDSIANVLSKTLTDNENIPHDPNSIADESVIRWREQMTDWSAHPELPEPTRLFARLLVLLGWPMHGKNRGLPILRVLYCLSSYIHPSLPAFWDAILPRMMAHLSQEESPSDHSVQPRPSDLESRSFNQDHWEELTLKMLSKSVDQVDDKDWNIELLHSLENQRPFYSHLPEERCFHAKCIGVVLCSIASEQVVTPSLDTIFNSFQPDSIRDQRVAVYLFSCVGSVLPIFIFNYLLNKFDLLWTEHVDQPNQINPNPKRLSRLFRSSSSSPRKYPSSSAMSINASTIKMLTLYTLARIIDQTSDADTLIWLLEHIFSDILPRFGNLSDETLPVQFAFIELSNRLSDCLTHKCKDLTSHDLLKSYSADLSHDLLSFFGSSKATANYTPEENNPSTPQLLSFTPPTPNVPAYKVPSSLQIHYLCLLAMCDLISSNLIGDKINASVILQCATSATMILPPCGEEGVDGDENMLPRDQWMYVDDSFRFEKTDNTMSNSVRVTWISHCVGCLHRLWKVFVQSYCSEDQLISMFQLLIPFLHTDVAHVTLRSLKLLTTVLCAICREMTLVSKHKMNCQGSSPPLIGQLAVHLVTFLDEQCSQPIRSEAMRALSQVECIQKLLLDPTPELSDSQMGQLQSETLVCEVADHVPKPQLGQVLDLIRDALLHSPRIPASVPGHSPPGSTILVADHAGECNTESIGPLPTGNTTADDALSQMWKTSQSSTTSEDVSSPTRAIHRHHDLIKLFANHNFPCSKHGYLVRFMLSLVFIHGHEMTESEVKGFLNSVYTIYTQLSQSQNLRAGLLLTVAELGRQKASLCLTTITASTLPLDDVWTCFLGAIAFLPSINDRPKSMKLTESDLPPVAGDAPLFCSLLSHILQLIDRCHPYEQRDIPRETRRIPTANTGDMSPFRQANFATHTWLSLINCLQVLSYPLTLDELVHLHDTDHNMNGVLSKQRKRLFRRSLPPGGGSGNALEAHSQQSANSMTCGLVKHFADPDLFTRLLGHWLIAYATCAICHTPAGKSYEYRSGAEAKLEHGFRPIKIATDGLCHFLESSGMHVLLRLLSLKPRRHTLPMHIDSSSKALMDPESIDDGKLDDPENFASVIEIIVSHLARYLKPSYTIRLVQFFLTHLSSSYEVRRRIAVVVLTSVLANLDSLYDGPNSTVPTSFSPNLLMDLLRKRINDQNPSIRLLVVASLTRIMPYDVLKPGIDADSSVVKTGLPGVHHRLRLMQRHATVLMKTILNVHATQKRIGSTFVLTVLNTLDALIRCTALAELAPLSSGITSHLLPVYSSPNPAICAAAFRVFGSLCDRFNETALNSVSTDEIADALETIHSSIESVFVPLLLHLADPDDGVVHMCKLTLKKIAPFLTSSNMEFPSDVVDRHSSAGEKRLIDFFHNCLQQSMRLHLGEFFNDLARILVSLRPGNVADYTMHCTLYFRSEVPELQCSAVLLTGSLVGHFTEDILSKFPSRLLFEDVAQLLMSNNPKVRATAVFALSKLSN